MSGRNNNNDDALRELLERITKKVENSPALNGGWDKLVISVEHIREKQEETCEKVDKISNALYEPDDGFFARVRTIEQDTSNIKERLEQHTEEDEKFYHEIKKVIDETRPSAESKAIVAKLQGIAGEDLEELAAVVKIRKGFQRMFWLIAAGMCSVIGKMLFDFFSSRH